MIVVFLLAKDFYTDTRVKQEVKTLISRGYNVVIISWDRECSYRSMRYSERLEIINLRMARVSRFDPLQYVLAALLFQGYAFLKIIALLKRYGRMVVQSVDFNTLVGASILRRVFKRRVGLVYDAHELTPAVYSEWFSEAVGKVVCAVEKRAMDNVDRVITVNRFLARYYESLTSSPVIVVPNFPEKKSIPRQGKGQLRSELHLPLDRIIISFVGMLRQDYALPELVSAAERYYTASREKKLFFLLVGYGPLKEDIYGVIRSRGVSEIFSLREKVLKIDSLKYIKASDYSYVVLRGIGFNTRYSSPWKLFESLACGTKLIVNGGTHAASYARKDVDMVIDEIDEEGVFEAFLRLSGEGVPPSEDYFWERSEKELLKVYQNL